MSCTILVVWTLSHEAFIGQLNVVLSLTSCFRPEVSFSVNILTNVFLHSLSYSLEF